jgi:hypothetical protein
MGQWLYLTECTRKSRILKIYNQMSDDDDELSPHQFEALCLEEAKLRRKGVEVQRRLRRAIKANREETTDLIKAHRLTMRQQRKARIEEHHQAREQQLGDRRAKMHPEALEKLRARIRKITELSKEAISRIEFEERKERMTAMRRR